MSFLIPLLYGVVQGLMEFLPVSSSAHLALIPHFLKTQDPGVFFDLTMHLGTAFAICLYFYKEIFIICRDFFYFFTFNKKKCSAQYPLMLNLLFSTMATFFMVIFFKRFDLPSFRAPLYMGLNLLFFGIVMYLADKFGPNLNQSFGHHRMERKFSWEKALWIGVFQAIAIFPGVSRSGATLTIGRFMGLSRKEASCYTFLLSLPIIFGGFLIHLREILNNGHHLDWSSSLIGGVTGLVVGLFTIKYFLQFVQVVGLGWFALYRALLALVIFYFYL